MWKWLTKKGSGKPGAIDDFAIDVLMRNLCDFPKCLPMLEQAGLSKEGSSKIYNLTVIACAVELISGMVPPGVLPEYYLLGVSPTGEREVRFAGCDVYQRARKLAKNYGHAYVIIGSHSGMMQSLNWCLNQLGAAANQELARIRLLPPKIPSFGEADFQARIVPSSAPEMEPAGS